VLGPLAGLVGWAFRRLTTWARTHARAGWRLPVTTTVVFAAVGALAIAVPLVLGNGRGPAAFAFGAGLPVGQLLALVALKPLATAACLRSGAIGGLLTPALATGAVFGALLGTGWLLMWPGSQAGAFAIVGAAAVLAVTQQAPLTAAVLALEFTHADLTLLVPVALAFGGAVAVGRAVLGPVPPELPYAPVPSRPTESAPRRTEGPAR
jgi:H+/Cl- antiporter ClcA